MLMCTVLGYLYWRFLAYPQLLILVKISKISPLIKGEFFIAFDQSVEPYNVVKKFKNVSFCS